MGIKGRIIRLEQKAGGTGNLSLIPDRERVICAEGYTKEEREIGFQVRLAELHKKYGDFDESCLTRIGIRLFSKDRLTT